MEGKVNKPELEDSIKQEIQDCTSTRASMSFSVVSTVFCSSDRFSSATIVKPAGVSNGKNPSNSGLYKP